MYRYIVKFSKFGYIKYISHLDLMRLFKRSFKRMGVKLEYSQGFNPHPKMGLAQPLFLIAAGIEDINYMYVDLSGAVMNPGVLKLEENTRVYQAIEISGGLK